MMIGHFLRGYSQPLEDAPTVPRRHADRLMLETSKVKALLTQGPIDAQPPRGSTNGWISGHTGQFSTWTQKSRIQTPVHNHQYGPRLNSNPAFVPALVQREDGSWL
ncbi:hypothetical protein GJ744_007227 [Endocarpon pusillum]|uniref:Uncharacterized protein n=1 Tax=Endocarpon pusillum TaxID=364733 RepID=A0A8H7AIV6_9EURO|nr:hypothetical protein GJ744_007227 [Endocarpon pusillum]